MHLATNIPPPESLLKPENQLELALIQAPPFRQGLLWGEPRYGHPEGKVLYHVREIFDNIDLINGLSAIKRQQLRLIALSHDTFKYLEDRSRLRDWSKHHGILARQFMESYTSDVDVLDVIEKHDDAYYTWLSLRHEDENQLNNNPKMRNLLEKINPVLQLYYLFFKCDTQTGDKTQGPLKWFERHMPGIELVRIKDFEP